MRKSVNNFEGYYSICSDGTLISDAKKWVRGFKKETILKGRINCHGYHQANLQTGKVYKTILVHRLVAEMFIPNPNNKPYVNHINGIKTDNRVENLEWCTQSENIKHSHKMGLKTQYKGKNPNARKVINNKTNDIFDCIDDGRLQTKYSYSYFYQMLSGKLTNKTDFSFYN